MEESGATACEEAAGNDIMTALCKGLVLHFEICPIHPRADKNEATSYYRKDEEEGGKRSFVTVPETPKDNLTLSHVLASGRTMKRIDARCGED